MNDDKLELRSCPVCGGSAATPFLELQYPEYGYPGNFTLKRCDACGLQFNSPRLRDDLLAKLYDRNYYLFLERPRDAVARIAQLFQETVAVLETRTPHRQILEVGCAKGYLLALLTARGWSTRGVELSAYAAGFASQRLGIPVHCGTLESWVASPDFQAMPVVVSTDVIEHVADLDGFARSLNAAVLEQGLLLIGTPNGDARGIERFGGLWLGFNPFHIALLSRDNLTQLLQRNGFTVELAYTYNNLQPAAQPLPGWRSKLAAVLDRFGLAQTIRQLKQGIAAFLDERALPLPRRITQAAEAPPVDFFTTPDGLSADALACRGDNLVVIARKTGAPLAALSASAPSNSDALGA